MKKKLVHAFGLAIGISTIANCLYLLGIVSKIWVDRGFLLFIICCTGLNISTLINNKRGNPPTSLHINKTVMILYVFLTIVWSITLPIAKFS